MPPKNRFVEIITAIFELLRNFYDTNRVPFLIVSAAVFFAGCVFLYAAVELTSTTAFCTSCHEMKAAHDSWKTSKHFNVEKGKRQATCRDCHLPPWSHPVELLFEKAYHGAKDVTGHFTEAGEFDEPGFYFDMKLNAAKTIHNYNCLKCHAGLYDKKYEGSQNIHKDLKNNPRFSCVKCHEGLVHKDYLPADIKQ